MRSHCTTADLDEFTALYHGDDNVFCPLDKACFPVLVILIWTVTRFKVLQRLEPQMDKESMDGHKLCLFHHRNNMLESGSLSMSGKSMSTTSPGAGWAS